MSNKKDQDSEKLTLWEIICSVLAAAFGVQSDKNRRRDFSKAKPSTFVIAGVIFTLLFVITLVGLVKLILNNAGA